MDAADVKEGIEPHAGTVVGNGVFIAFSRAFDAVEEVETAVSLTIWALVDWNNYALGWGDMIIRLRQGHDGGAQEGQTGSDDGGEVHSGWRRRDEVGVRTGRNLLFMRRKRSFA